MHSAEHRAYHCTLKRFQKTIQARIIASWGHPRHFAVLGKLYPRAASGIFGPLKAHSRLLAPLMRLRHPQTPKHPRATACSAHQKIRQGKAHNTVQSGRHNARKDRSHTQIHPALLMARRPAAHTSLREKTHNPSQKPALHLRKTDSASSKRPAANPGSQALPYMRPDRNVRISC